MKKLRKITNLFLLLIVLLISACKHELQSEVVEVLDLGFNSAFIIKGTENGETILMLIDSGIPTKSVEILGTILDMGYSLGDLKYIFITHAHLDHYGSAQTIRKKTGAKIIVHVDDSDAMINGQSPIGDIAKTDSDNPLISLFDDIITYLAGVPLQRTPPDILVNDGDSLEQYGFDAEVVHLPGHTLGSSGILLNNGDTLIAFTGDLVNNERETGKPYFQDLFAESWVMVAASAEKLKNIAPDIIHPGHGVAFTNAELQTAE